MNKIKQFIILIAGICLYSCAGDPEFTGQENFNYDWQFYKSRDTSSQPPATVNWEKVDLPHTANLEPLTVISQWQGICFYKKDFKLDNNYNDKILTLQFDGAMNVADVWVNGQHMTRHMGGYLPFFIPLNEVVRFDTINTVLVRLDNRDNPITGPKPMKILDFNMYGGIYRNVYLTVKEKIHLTHPVEANVVAAGGVFFATTSGTRQQATFGIKSHVQNQSDQSAEIRITHQLTDPSGQVVATLESDKMIIKNQNAAEMNVRGSIESPSLWSPATPHLYTLKTDIYADGTLTDSQSERVGIRSIRITPEGLFLNEEKTFLRGVNRHQEYPYVGYALSDAAQYRDAYKIKQAGFDFVRSSHYPMSPFFLDACDELGIMVLDAILGWQYFGRKEF